MKNQKSVSTYLDLVRFSAAALVVLEHSVLLGLLPPMGLLTRLSHEAVVVFFVLSGFVIASSRTSQDGSPRDYIVSRAARLYSVALPALVLCYGAFLVTGASSGAGAASVWTRFLSSLFFFDGVWFNYRDVPFNGPYWSLCYEAWYYAFWGVLCFVRSSRVRMMAAAGLLVMMGPAIAALAGIWLLGAVMAMRWPAIRARLADSRVSALLATMSLLLFVVVAGGSLQDDVRAFMSAHVHGWWRLRGAELMPTDYLLGVLVAVHLAAAGAWLGDGRRLHDSRAGRVIRSCARFTFALYLFHYPILIFVKSMFMPSLSLPVGLAVVAFTTAACAVIALGTEWQLPRWRRVLSAALARPHAETHAITTANLIRG